MAAPVCRKDPNADTLPEQVHDNLLRRKGFYWKNKIPNEIW